MTKDLPCPKALRNIMRYDPDTGKLFWRERSDRPRQWNSRWAGKEAFTANRGDGYRCGRINGKTFFAHRVIWAIVHGHWPEQDIDHINGIRNDNRLSNLRSVSRSENMKNKMRPPSNTSGFIGVTWNKKTGKWQAQIQVDGRSKTLGNFSDKSDAVKARRKAEKDLGFHINHGR